MDIFLALAHRPDEFRAFFAHGAILRIRANAPLAADQVAVNYRKADVPPRQRAMLDFAMRLALVGTPRVGHYPTAKFATRTQGLPRAVGVSAERTKKAAVTKALREFIARHQQQNVTARPGRRGRRC